MSSKRMILILAMVCLTILFLMLSSSPTQAQRSSAQSRLAPNPTTANATPPPIRIKGTESIASAPRSMGSTCTLLTKPGDVYSPTTINFDDLAPGTVVGDSYKVTHGVEFNVSSSTITYARENVNYVSAKNVAINEPKSGDSNGLEMTISFGKPMVGVGMYIGGGNGTSTPATLTAFDSGGAVICHVDYPFAVPAAAMGFFGLKDESGAEISKVTLSYGTAPEPETIDNLMFSAVLPPLPCGVTWKTVPGSVFVGERIPLTWTVESNSYDSTQTYLVYDSISHPQTGAYASLQVPSPNTGMGDFTTSILARAVGTLYIRPALSYQENKGDVPKTCQGAEQIEVEVKDWPTPTPTPAPGGISGTVRTSKGATLSGVTLGVMCPGIGCLTDTSKSDGTFSFNLLPPGDYTLNATKTGYDPFSTRVTVRAGQVTSVIVTLRLTPTPTPAPALGMISAHVLERDTNIPLNGASLELRPYLGNTSTHFDYATSAVNGGFTFTNVPVGSWFVFVTKRDYNFFFGIYHVTLGGTATGDILLQPRYRIPTPVPSSPVDLTVAHVMAIQASQKWDNSLELAAGRETALRVFVNLGGGAAADLHGPVMGYLYSPECLPELGLDSSWASPLPVSTWNTSNAQRDAVLSDAARTMNFILPLSCTTPGTRHFRVRIRPTIANPERDLSNNELDISLTFNQKRPLMVFVRRISLGNSILCPRSHMPEPPASAIAPAMRLLRQMYPTTVNWIDIGREDFCASPRTGYYEHLAGWGWINFGLSLDWSMFAIPSAPGFGFPGTVPTVPMVYGLVDGAECAAPYSCPAGQTPMIFSHHWVSSGITNSPATAPHEVGHARGLLHASNDHDEASGGDYISWPYRHGAMSQLGANETWGYDPHAVDDANPQGTVYAPISNTFTIRNPDLGYPHELMSYGYSPRWLSDINWSNLIHSFRLPWSGDEAQTKLPESTTVLPRLLIGGYQHPVDGLKLIAIRPTEMEISLDPAGATHTIQLKALDGTVLASRMFKPFRLEGDKYPSFQLVISRPDGVVSVDILEGTTVVTSYYFSSESPEVRITAPTGSGTYDTNLTLDWDASDPDGHPLMFDIAYSPDGGATWQGVVSLLPSGVRTYDIDLSSLPGSENAFFKVIASDGFNTSSAITPAPLIIGRKAPQASITSLTDGDRFTPDQIIRLEGSVMDLEEIMDFSIIPPYKNVTFTWTSDRDGVIGSRQEMTTFGLSIGTHIVTLTATDSDGMTGSDSVTIQVFSPNIFLPIITR